MTSSVPVPYPLITAVCDAIGRCAGMGCRLPQARTANLISPDPAGNVRVSSPWGEAWAEEASWPPRKCFDVAGARPAESHRRAGAGEECGDR